MLRLAALLLGLVSALLHGTAHAQATVAAAADLKFAVEEVAARFTSDTGRSVRLVFGSSGNFARQLQEGAPFQLFMSADEDLVFRLADAGKTEDRGMLYATGRLVLFAPTGSVLTPDADMRDLGSALKDGRLKRFAIANPEHAPYGKRAEEALRHAGLWDAIQPRLVLGENISQAAQFAVSGDTQGGIVAYSLVLSPQLADRGKYVLIPADWHEPLRQRMALLKGIVEAALTLPLVLPPTVLGYYLLTGMSSRSPLGGAFVAVFGHPLAFNFEGLLVASVIVNLPFAIQPIQRSFEAIGQHIHDAAACCGLSRWRTLWRIELPLAWSGVLSAVVMTFAHTLGEFGVVLMVGGNIPGQTRTLAISIYDRMQSFDDRAAGSMSGLLLMVSLAAIALSYIAGRRGGSRRARR